MGRHGLPNDLGIQGWVRPRRDFGIKQGVFAMMLAGGLTLFLLTKLVPRTQLMN